MDKNARIEIGKTPSVVSGNPATTIQDGEPVCEPEKASDPGLVKMAKALSEEWQNSKPKQGGI